MIWIAIITLLAGYTAWCTLLYFSQDGILFPRSFAPAPIGSLPAGAEVLTRPLDGPGQAVAWFFPAHAVSPSRPAPLLVYFHGNAEIIDYQTDIVREYLRMGFAVLLPEYRGYGRAGGSPSQSAIHEDAVAFLDMALARPDVDASRLVYHGRSLGGGPAGDLARHHPPAALILESTFTSAAAMARQYFVPSILVSHPFRTDRVLAQLDLPCLIIHGTHDPIIPVAHGRALHHLARRATYVELDFAHDDAIVRGLGDTYWRTIGEFLHVNHLSIPHDAPR